MLQILQYPFSPLLINTYILVAPNKECVVIDPGAFFEDEKKFLLNEIETRQLKPVALWQTHAHFDHVFATKLMVDKFSLKPKIHELEKPVIERVPQAMMLYNLAFDNYTGDFEFFLPNEKYIYFNEYPFEIIHTPGHSHGSVSYYCAAQNFIVSGDVLFKNSIGRYDLPGADFETLKHSLLTKIYTLPPQTKVYNGHGEPTTVGYEMRNNPFVRAVN
jgi:glyoxylase-like metal-dependent hydrolase (beta-lactamase superfamily II)